MTFEVYWIHPKSQRQKTFTEDFSHFSFRYVNSSCLILKTGKKESLRETVDRKLHGCIIFNLVADYEKGVHNLSVNKIQLEGRSIQVKEVSGDTQPCLFLLSSH